jgi:hypothetical protein
VYYSSSSSSSSAGSDSLHPRLTNQEHDSHPNCCRENNLLLVQLQCCAMHCRQLCAVARCCSTCAGSTHQPLPPQACSFSPALEHHYQLHSSTPLAPTSSTGCPLPRSAASAVSEYTPLGRMWRLRRCMPSFVGGTSVAARSTWQTQQNHCIENSMHV